MAHLLCRIGIHRWKGCLCERSGCRDKQKTAIAFYVAFATAHRKGRDLWTNKRCGRLC
jgi:hypothetical protein